MRLVSLYHGMAQKDGNVVFGIFFVEARCLVKRVNDVVASDSGLCAVEASIFR